MLGRRGKDEYWIPTVCKGFQAVLVVQNPPANAVDVRDVGSIPGWGRSPRGGHGNPLQYSCLENPMDRGAWRATVHRVTKSRTRLKQLTTCALYAKPHVRRQGGFKRLVLEKLMLLLFNHIQIPWRKLIWSVLLSISDHRPCRYPHQSNELVQDWVLCVPFVGLDHRAYICRSPFFSDSLHLCRTRTITFAISTVLSCNSQSYVHPIFTFNMRRGRDQRWTLRNTHRV